MIIWRGRGVVIALIALACFVIAELATFGDTGYYQTHGWPKLVAFWVAAGIVFALRSWLGVEQQRTLVDTGTGQEVKMSREAQLFFIPARYWPAILLTF
jgi:hypothetical protein